MTNGILDLTLCESHALRIIILEYFSKDPSGQICCLSKYYTQVFWKLFYFVKSKVLCINVSISLIWLLIRSFSKYVAKFELKLIWNLKLSKQPLIALECFYYILQSNLVIKNGLIRNKLVLRNHLRGPIYQFTT